MTGFLKFCLLFHILASTYVNIFPFQHYIAVQICKIISRKSHPVLQYLICEKNKTGKTVYDNATRITLKAKCREKVSMKRKQLKAEPSKNNLASGFLTIQLQILLLLLDI